MAWFRCKFRKEEPPVISYQVDCCGNSNSATVRKYENNVLKSTTNISMPPYQNYDFGKLRIETYSYSYTNYWRFYCISNYIEYNNTRYSKNLSSTIASLKDKTSRTTLTFIERDS